MSMGGIQLVFGNGLKFGRKNEHKDKSGGTSVKNSCLKSLDE